MTESEPRPGECGRPSASDQPDSAAPGAPAVNAVVVSFTPDRSETLAVGREILARSWQLWAVALGGGALVAGGCLLLGVRLAGSAPVGAIFAAWYLTEMLLLKPRSNWRKLVARDAVRIQRFGEEGVMIDFGEAKITYDWTAFSKAAKVHDVYVLRLSLQRNGVVMTPRRAFASPDDEERFRHLVAGGVQMSVLL